MNLQCYECQKPNSTKRCGQCHSAIDCSKACQVSHWKDIHKYECNKTPEDKVYEAKQKTVASASSVSMMDSLIKTMLLSEPKPKKSLPFDLKKIMAVYERTPNMDEEFKSYIRRKKIRDIQMESIELLREVVILSKSLYMHEIMFYNAVGSSQTHPLLNDPATIFKLLNTNDPEKLMWFFKASANDVFIPKTASGYVEQLHHSFSNAFVQPRVYESGRNHIAVGFVDLSILLWMDYLRTDPGPLHFIGFEMSPFSVAKTLIIAEMLRRLDDGIIDAIIQVWYSSCWSENTVKIFRAAVAEVKKSVLDEEIRHLINHWSEVEAPSLQTSRKLWHQKISISALDPAIQVLDKENRNILIEYLLTGQLLPATVGSITMFELPKQFKSGRSRDESCFHSIDFASLGKSARSHGGDFVAAAISIFRGKISRLHELVVQGDVIITIKPPVVVSLDNSDVIRQISELKPYTISWNNCSDYINRDEFHRLARLCSASKDTVHSGYSMNWPSNVFGSSCLTYPVGKGMIEVMEQARNAIEFSSDRLGFGGLLLFPPIDNPINVMSHVTQCNSYKYWVEYFFEKVPNIAKVNPPVIYNPFARANSILQFTWTYDESITFEIGFKELDT